MAARKILNLSHQWIVSLCLAVQFSLLIAAIVTVTVNKAMIEQGNTSAILAEGNTGVFVAYEICWSIPLIITIGEIVLFISYSHYSPRMFLLSNIVKYMFAVAGLVLCVTRARHGIAIVIVVGLIIVLFLPPIIYGSVVYNKAQNQGISVSTNDTLDDTGSTDIVFTGGAADNKSRYIDRF